MITEDLIKSEIERLEKEQSQLQIEHQRMAQEEQVRQQAFQQQVVNNQNRFQQLKGAIAHLKQLLNGKEPPCS